jgi:hypothetical protein
LKIFQSLESTHYVFKALILILTHLSSQSTQPNGSSSAGPLLWRRFVILSPRPNNLAMGCVSNGLLQLSPGDPAEGLLHTNKIRKYEHKKNVLDTTGMILRSHPPTTCTTLTEMYFYLCSCSITLKMPRLCDCASLIHLSMNVLEIQLQDFRCTLTHFSDVKLYGGVWWEAKLSSTYTWQVQSSLNVRIFPEVLHLILGW